MYAAASASNTKCLWAYHVASLFLKLLNHLHGGMVYSFGGVCLSDSNFRNLPKVHHWFVYEVIRSSSRLREQRQV